MRPIRDIIVSEALAAQEKLASQAITRAEVRGVLKLCCSIQHRITYVCLAKALGMFSGGTELARILGEIMQEDAYLGEPVLSSLVVKSTTGMPGSGYYTLAIDLFGISTDAASLRDFWFRNVKNLGIEVDPTNISEGLVLRSSAKADAADSPERAAEELAESAEPGLTVVPHED